jgi:WD40 repeat protein
MNVRLRHLASLLAGMIFFSNLSLAVCPGSSHQTSLAGYALSPDATRIAAIAEDGALFWWDVASGKRTQLAECVQPEVFDHPILFSPDSTRLAIALGSGVQIFNISTGNVIARLTSPKLKEIYNIIFSGDGRQLAESFDAGAVVWDINSQAEIASMPANPIRNALALTRDGALLALGCWDGLELWTVNAKGGVRRFAGGVHVESAIFAHHDQWIVALTATALPPQPKQRVQKYKREITVWDIASGNKLKTLTADAEPDELRFGLTSGGPHLLLATDFKGHLREWNLDSGELTATWETSSGHPSADGKLLLREGSAAGRLELWKIGSPDEQARSFGYKSPLCAESFADDKGNVKFEALFVADGFSDNEQPFGSSVIHGYLAQDCTRVNITRLSFKTEERARQKLDHAVAQAIEVVEKGPPKDYWQQVFLGERRVLRFPGRSQTLGPFAVIWLEGTSLFEIDSSSLLVALAMEKQALEKR